MLLLLLCETDRFWVHMYVHQKSHDYFRMYNAVDSLSRGMASFLGELVLNLYVPILGLSQSV